MKHGNIKLIIWDLDDTFWHGIFSEGDVTIPADNLKFLADTLDMGIVHSICSKNDFDKIKAKLLQEKLWDCFVFPSIDWTSKGNRVKNIIETMKLRAENVLFIDDNNQNLEEVRYFSPSIMTLHASEIPSLILALENLEKKDPSHTRLQQYHLLEEKECERTKYNSNDDFLYSCNIRVEIKNNCIQELDRIHDLIMRSNQLNYTKYRQSKEDLYNLLSTTGVESGYVTVRDKFGNYGIVGFYAIKNGEVVHYVFSCRTLGMKVEQFVYSKIGYPSINIQGEVVSELNNFDCPGWINQENHIDTEASTEKVCIKKKILIKGPCDMSQMHTFLSADNTDGILTEFTYINDAGISVEGHNHTAQIATALYSSESRRREIVSDVNFFDEHMLDTELRNANFGAVVLSMLTDGNLGVYRRKTTGEYIAFGEKFYPLDSNDNREKYINNRIFTSRVKFSEDLIDKFSNLYEFVDNSDFHITMESLDRIYAKIPGSCEFILLLGSEREFPKKCKESFAFRHLEHKRLNDLIREWAKSKANVILLCYDNYISSDSDFLDTINHFSKKVYYDVAKDIITSITNGTDLKIKGRFSLLIATIKQKLRQLKKTLKSFFCK